jgi:hypothetical protein
MKNHQRGSIMGLILVIFLFIAGTMVFLTRNEEKAYALFNKYVNDDLVEKILQFFSFWN